jgi:anti-sigma regulatory factor (Ser/Thr protein kinase)
MAKASMTMDSGIGPRGTRPVDLQVELVPEPSAAAVARDALEVFSERLSERRFADLRVIVTELVTNSVKYGPGKPIALTVDVGSDGVVRGDVEDGGDGGVHMRCPGPLGGGLGLVIVEALASWGVRPDSSHVWFELEDATPEYA